ncbi:MAG: molybdopterin-binding protein, partial [Desulfobacteraceae bacterium]
MKIVPVTEAVGMVLCHDVTRIVQGREKGPAFKRGHVITGRDVEPL